MCNWLVGAAALSIPIPAGRTLLPGCFVAPSQVGSSKGCCGWPMKRALIAADWSTSCINADFWLTSMVQQLNDHGIHKKLPVKSCTKKGDGKGEGESLPTNAKGSYRTTTKEGVLHSDRKSLGNAQYVDLQSCKKLRWTYSSSLECSKNHPREYMKSCRSCFSFYR